MLINKLACLLFRGLSVLPIFLSPVANAQTPAKEKQFGSRLKENPGGNVAERVGGRLETRINNRIQRENLKNIDAIYVGVQKVNGQSPTAKRSVDTSNVR